MEVIDTVWYTTCMPTPNVKEKRSETVGAKVPPSVKRFIGELVDQEDRTESYIVLALIERGIAAYNRDGLIKEPEQTELKEKSPKVTHRIKAS